MCCNWQFSPDLTLFFLLGGDFGGPWMAFPPVNHAPKFVSQANTQIERPEIGEYLPCKKNKCDQIEPECGRPRGAPDALEQVKQKGNRLCIKLNAAPPACRRGPCAASDDLDLHGGLKNALEFDAGETGADHSAGRDA
jgi:hypothetical protein